MKAFITGSTGLLGSNLVNLLLEQGHEVKALARSEAKARKLWTDPRIEIIQGDMEAVDGFAAELQGCDVLFHTAAYFREYFSPGDHWVTLEKINVHGTIKLLEQAEKAGVKKAIYVSSSGVIGRKADGSAADESTPPDQLAEQENLYFKSKVVAEQAIASFLKTHHLPVVLILPTAMIGPQDTGPTTLGQAMVDLLNRKIPVIPPGGFEFVDARDVAQGMINAVEKGKSGERYIFSQGYRSMADLAKTVGVVSGVPAPRLQIPYPIMLNIARLDEFRARITGSAPQIPVSAVKTMRQRYLVTAAKARRELGATFRTFEQSIKDEVDWYCANGYVTQ